MIAHNMPSASKMKQFAADWNFEVVTSNPRYPQSNGQSKRFVKKLSKQYYENVHRMDPTLTWHCWDTETIQSQE